MNTETLVVAESIDGKFGPQLKDADGNYFSFGKFYKGPTVFDVGDTLKVELYTTAKGHKYINKAELHAKEKASPKVKESKAEAPKKEFKAKEDTSMSKADWANKDRSQLLGGLCHDAAQLTLAAVNGNLEAKDVLAMYKVLLDGVIELRCQVK